MMPSQLLVCFDLLILCSLHLLVSVLCFKAFGLQTKREFVRGQNVTMLVPILLQFFPVECIINEKVQTQQK